MLCSRIGDTVYGTCYAGNSPSHSHGGSHDITGTIISGASITFAEGSLIARVGDMVLSDCNIMSTIIDGSGTVFVEGLPTARVGDSFDGTFKGKLTSGAGSVLIGG